MAWWQIWPYVPSAYEIRSGFLNVFFISTGLGNVTSRPPSDYEHLSTFTPIDDHQSQPYVKPICTHKIYHTVWYTIVVWVCCIDVQFCFNKYIQSRRISQSFLGEVFLGEVSPSCLKSLKAYLCFQNSLLPQKPQFRPNEWSEMLQYTRVLNVIWKSLLETLNRKGFLSQFESALKIRPYISR